LRLKNPVTHAQELRNLAFAIAPERARMLLAEQSGREGGALGVLLGAAFPALTPSAGYQHDALDLIAREGFRARRRRRELFPTLRSALQAHGDSEQGIGALRRRVWGEKARIALRELLPVRLGGASIEVTAGEISDLAAAAFDASLTEAEAAVAERFGPPLRADGLPSTLVMLGLGKLGGGELNAGSDVDVMFIYDTDEGESQISLHEHFSRVVRRAVATMGTPSKDGLIWRVDLRLRPEGAAGAIVNSVAAAERYYETWGRLWERAALLRARPCAGDLELGRLLSRELVMPFVYRNRVDPTIAEALSELVVRSRSELSLDPNRDLKLGPGGIREAEFFVQSLQLVWGGREQALRVQGTLPALARLRSQGLVSDREARGIAESYVLLRRVEHRVQWASGVQTHLLPSDDEEYARLARSLGFSDGSGLRRELELARERVSSTFQSLTHAGAPEPGRARGPLASELEGDDPELGRVAEEQFHSADIGEHIAALARRPDGLLGALTRDRHPELAARVLDALSNSADPEQAARYLRAFFGRFLAPAAYVNALGDDPRALQRLITAFGASAFVGDAVSSRPELADVILFGGGAVSDPQAAVRAEIWNAAQSLSPDSDHQEREESFIGALRAAKRRITVEVAVADLAGTIGMRDATTILADLAEEILACVVRHVFGDVPGFAVLGLGKLGGRDLGYTSDLDVVFMFLPSAAPEPPEATTYFVRGAQRVIRLLTEPHAAGPGYELDARLRPSGSHGLLVTSLASFARYHGQPIDGSELEPGPAVLSSGAPWERQTLLRARGVVGDPDLLRRALTIAWRAAYEAGAPPASEMHHLRTRLEKEQGREREGRYNLKTGHGGLLDIEFAVQWLQMKNGADPRVRTPDLGVALTALHNAGYLERMHFEVFNDGYRFLRQLEQRIVVKSGVSGVSGAVVDTRNAGFAQLARRMGFQDGQGQRASEHLLARYKAVTESVRGSYEQVLGLG
jgi:[glutamine synthetase] adenylyltransferase / [glutamine synthetase]-adenylyl-L-tyrosine phosphorylase